MAGLGDLVVSLTAETAQFRQAMERAAYVADKNFSQMRNSAANLAAGFGLYLGADTFVSFIRASIDMMDKLDDMSEKVGIATDELSKLAYSAKFANVDVNGLQSALVKFSKNASEAATGSGEAAGAFQALGISVKDANGNLKPTEELVKDVADAFVQYEDGAGKVSAATALFGKSGAELIPMLNKGRDGLKEQADELERLGGVVMPDAAKRSAEFKDNVDRLSTAMGGFGKIIANEILPTLTEYTNQILLATKHQLTFMDKLKLGLTNPFGNVADEIKSLREEYDTLMRIGFGPDSPEAQSVKRREAYLKELQAMEVLAGATGDMSDAVSRRMASQASAAKGQLTFDADALKRQREAAQKVSEFVKQQQDAYFQLTMTKEEYLAQQAREMGANKQQVQTVSALAAAMKAYTEGKEKEKAITDIIGKQREAYVKLFLTEDELLKLTLEKNGADEDSMRIFDALTQAIKAKTEADQKQKDAMKDYMDLYSEWKKLVEDTNTPMQKLADGEARLEELRKRLIAAGYEEIEVNNRIAEARLNLVEGLEKQDKLTVQVDTTSKLMGQAISSQFEAAILQGKAFREVLKGIGNDIIAILVRRRITEPFADFVDAAAKTYLPSFGGAKANGGLVTGGNAYLVGERGPEIFLPSTGGSIIPNSAAASSGGNVSIDINNYSGQQVQTREAKDSRGNRSISIQIGDLVAQELGRPGSTANMSLRNNFGAQPTLVGR